MRPQISRRQVLLALAMAAGGIGWSWVTRLLGIPSADAGAALDSRIYLPQVGRNPTPAVTPTATRTATPTATRTATSTATPTATATTNPGTGPKVIHVHAASATSWNYISGYYWNYVSQSVVNNMVNEGLKRLTSQSTVAAAWQTLLPNYNSGQRIAIKVNFNNSGTSDCNVESNVIDGLIQPVNALLQGLIGRGVPASDIWIYDASRSLPDHFRNNCSVSGVHFVTSIYSPCGEKTTFNSSAPNAQVTFGNSNLTARRIADALINATYLINMPIMKDHGFSGVTLGFKNHFGTIDRIMSQDPDSLHLYIDPTKPQYSANYSPLVDIYKNTHIRTKTVLTVGDGLYGALGNTNVIPTRWQTFGNAAANSLFFAVDPVAIDCVMMDILHAEPVYHPAKDSGHVDDYLKLAANSSNNLGVYERGNPWTNSYTKINYQKIEL